MRSNGNAFGSYYADPEAGLLYARARYFGPISGQFVSRDPVEGEANLPITWGAYQYGRSNPYRYSDSNGKCDNHSTLDDCATEISGGLVGSIGLTTFKAIEGVTGTLQFTADFYLEGFGNKAAKEENDNAAHDRLTGSYYAKAHHHLATGAGNCCIWQTVVATERYGHGPGCWPH
ncbi:RHS repeat-associated core domain-containing protein [Acidovorax sp. NPDC077693]|uniref:RHS repeat-associated core domain-containing protein n=1 Tax=unclassified Acidovorax TaxID=2684926 RepID=UPI0037C9A5CF